MSSIDRLSQTDSVSSADQIPLYSVAGGADRKVAASTLADFIAGQIAVGEDFITQYFAPNASGWSVQVVNGPDGNGANIWLLITPLADYAAGTIVLPVYTTVGDGQELLVNSTHAVAALTISGNGAVGVNGAPTTLAAGGHFRLRYDKITNSWYAV